MANTIKIGSLDISAFKVGSDDCKVYLGDTLLYPQGQPAFQGKWKATYQDSHVESAECDSYSSEIVSGEIYPENLVSVEIGDCVTSIGNSTFYDCNSLTSIDIPSGVTSISDYAFEDCTSLTSCTIGSGVTSIGNYAFRNCTSLTSIDIPDSVTSIGNYAFEDCTGLTSITVNATTPPTLGGNAFYGSTCPILVPSESVSAYKRARGAWRSYASRIQAIPNS